MADRLDVLLGILLDKASQRDLERGLSSIESHIKSLDEQELDNLLGGFDDIINAAELMEKKFQAARAEAQALSQTASQIGRIGAVLTAAGAAIVGGIALSAGQYVSFVEKAGIQGDETADRWIAATKRVQNAQLNLGEASAQVLLPVYEKAAELAEKAAAFVQENPDLVRAALNTGLVVATLGAVGVAVSKGIKLYADFKYLAATTEYSLATTRFQTAVHEFLAGSALPRGGGGATAAGGGAAGGLAGTVAGAAIAVTIGTLIAKAVVDAVSQGLAETEFGKQIDEAQRRAAEGGGGYPGINRYARETEKADQAAEDAAQSTADLSAGLRDFQQEAIQAQATDVFIQYRQQEAQAEENYMRQRAQIVEQGAQQIAQIEANYAQQRARLIEQFAASSAQAVSNFQFQQQQAAKQFAFSEAQALQDFNERRTEQREEFQEQEERSREDHLREMRRLEEEHQDRRRDLIAARDALGLVREDRDFARRQREAEEDYRVERNRRRQDFQRRQRDQEEEFQQERQRRRQEFAFRQKQAAEQFAYQQAIAKQQFEERLKQLDDQHQVELSQARRQTAERLRELELQFRQEQVTRRNAFFDILRDLDANLLNERNLRVQYYAQMQQDLLAFLQQTASGGYGSNLPGYQEGGYTPEGAIRAHRGEFVANRKTTRSLEGLVGGRLTQRAVQNLVESRSNTINLEFPGGLVTTKVLADALEENNSNLLRDLVKGLV